MNVLPTLLTTPGNEIGSILTKHPDIGGVTFTGSVATGKAIAAVCADGVKRVCLELGGNDAGMLAFLFRVFIFA